MDYNDYYYVGKTRNFHRRMEQHLDKQGAAWFRNFPQDAIVNAVTTPTGGEIDDNNSYEETRETLRLMVEHGVRYVRGAEYCESRDYDANDANRIQYAVMHHLGRTDIDVVFQGLIQGLGDVPVATARPLPAPTRPLSAPVRTLPTPLPAPSPTDRTNGGGRKRPRSSQRGYCIRCAGNPRIMYGSLMRYCNTCYDAWSGYQNSDYRERFCNNCGTAQRSPKLSYNNPRCINCQ